MAGNVDLVRDAVEAFNAHDRERYVSAYHPGVTLHGFPEGVVDAETLGDFYAGFWQGVPDARIALEDTVAEGDRLALRLHMTGTHEGELMGVPASGRPIAFDVITIMRFEDGRVAERWNVADFLAMLQQIGAVPAPA